VKEKGSKEVGFDPHLYQTKPPLLKIRRYMTLMRDFVSDGSN